MRLMVLQGLPRLRNNVEPPGPASALSLDVLEVASVVLLSLEGNEFTDSEPGRVEHREDGPSSTRLLR